ncbi:MAG TPA: restriction endonuclease subunit S [Nitrospiraceae bacterium]|jgi:type I restriction enzyme S subunit|nr:restriction endonuclease subunit S [Nitrospiraceae bacterium]HEV8620550.1 restriction endonuclease subunit S [Nitrospiraceae bacterium]
MASDWRTCTVDQIKADDGRAIAIGPFGSRMKADRYVADGVPVIRGNNISDTRTLVGDLVFVSDETADELRSCNVFPGDLVFPHRGAIGQVGIVPSDQMSRYILSSSLMKLTCNQDLVDPLFIFYFFRSQDGRHALLQNASTVGTPGIGQPLASLRSISVPVPPLPEQRAIAHILGTLDDKIELNQRMNETLEAKARALFKSWFVDFDPVRAKAEGRDPGLPKPFADLFPDSFVDSELEEIPKGWETRSLYESAEFINGAAFKSEDFCDPIQGLPIVKIAELKDGISAQTKFSDRVMDPKQLIDTGELLYSWSGSPDTSLDAFLWTKGRGLLNQHIFKVVTPTIAEKRFVYYLLKFLRPTLVEIARNKQTTGLGHVTVADMKRLYVCSPPLKVLLAFDNRVAPLFDRAFKNTIQNQTLAALRDTLLLKLISGELRVKDAEGVCERVCA